MSALSEGRLGPPEPYVLRASGRSNSAGHPLSHLAEGTRARSLAAKLDPAEALARDAMRFERTSGPVWGLSAANLPEVLVIGRIRDSGGCYPLDRFVGI